MQVLFNFPNGLAFEITMDAVPRTGDIVNLLKITQSDFQDKLDYDKYIEYEYASFSWMIDGVIWTPAAGNRSYVNVVLKRKL
jgi:hypothetical protein